MTNTFRIFVTRLATPLVRAALVALAAGASCQGSLGGGSVATDEEPMSCAESGDLACRDTEYCAANGACVTRLEAGSTGCDRDRMCDSDNCVGPVCCPAECAACNGFTCLLECGDGEIEELETCDQGLQNGVRCEPLPNDTCQYCTANCQWETVTYVPPCGQGAITETCICGGAAIYSGHCCAGVAQSEPCPCQGDECSSVPPCGEGAVAATCVCGGTTVSSGYCCAGAAQSDLCLSCGEGAVAATCVCGGTTVSSGYCCVGVAQSDPCLCQGDDECPSDYDGNAYCYLGDVYRDFHDYSCGDDGCAETLIPNLVQDCGAGSQCQGGSCSPISGFSCAGIDTSKFDVIFCQDFNDDTIGGSYNRDNPDYLPDWNNDVIWDGISCDDCVTIRQNADPENPSKVMRKLMPNGCWGTGAQPSTNQCGAYWWAKLQNLDAVDGYDELYFSYNLKFRPGMWWIQGGKIMGVGGVNNCKTYGEDFSPEMMWKQGGAIVSFVGHHNQQSPTVQDTLRWNAHLDAGKWNTLTLRVVNNTVGNNNGIVEGYLDGVLKTKDTNFNFRGEEDCHFTHVRVASWPGGGETWAVIRDEWIDLDNFVVYRYKSNINVPRGNVFSPDGRVLDLPNLLHTPPNPAADTPITVNAFGTARSGEYARFMVLVNNSYIGEATTTSSLHAYNFTTDFLLGEIDLVTVEFINAGGNAEEGWSTLTVPSISVDGTVYPTTGTNVVWDAGTVDMMDTSAGQEYQTWIGGWVFSF